MTSSSHKIDYRVAHAVTSRRHRIVSIDTLRKYIIFFEMRDIICGLTENREKAINIERGKSLDADFSQKIGYYRSSCIEDFFFARSHR